MTEKLSEREAMRKCSYLLPDPGGEVVRKLLDEVAALERQLDRWYELYAAVNEMMCELGKVGEINTRHADVDGVMGALHDIDGGDYLTREQLQKRLDAERDKG